MMYQSNRKISFGARIVTAILIFVFAFSSFLFLPQKAHALVPVVDPGLIAISADIAKDTLALNLKEYVLDPILYAVEKVLIQNILQSIVTWAQNGFNGSPAFIQSPGDFLRTVGDQTAGLVIQDIAPFLCEPFRLNIQTGLSLHYSLPVFDKIECTLSDVIGNMDGFLAGDFSGNGGWNGLARLSLDSRNNPMEVYMAGQAAVTFEAAKQREQQKVQLDWGKGFLSFKDASGNIVTPGNVISEQINKSLGAGQDALVAADEIDEVIAAVIGSLVSNLLSNGNGLLGL